MGNPAVYVIRRNGQATVFASNWAASDFWTDIFWGPEVLQKVVPLFAPCDTIFETAEAGLLLDLDNSTLSWFEDSSRLPEDDGPTEWEAYSPLLEAVWRSAGWTIREISDVGELATLVGVEVDEREQVAGAAVPPYDPSYPRFGMLLTIARGKHIDDRMMQGWDDAGASPLLHIARLAADPSSFPTLEDLHRIECERALSEWCRLAKRVRSAVHVDVESKMVLAYAPPAHPKFRAQVAANAPGFRIEFHNDGLTRHFAASGRSVPEFVAPPKSARETPPLLVALEKHLPLIMGRLMREYRFSEQIQGAFERKGYVASSAASWPEPALPLSLEERYLVAKRALISVAPHDAGHLLKLVLAARAKRAN